MAESPQIVDMLDTIGANAAAIPAGTRRVAIYVTGSGSIPWSAADVARLRKDDRSLQALERIDQTNSVLSFPYYVIKDVEPGASSNQTAVDEAKQRAARGQRTGLYTYLDNFEPLRQLAVANGLNGHVDYWVAAWNLSREEAVIFIEQHPDVVAVQWASPSSNPDTLVPGSKRTLREANVDLSVTRAGWPAALPPAKKRPVRRVIHGARHVVKKPAKPSPKVTAGALGGVLAGAVVTYLNSHGVGITHLNAQEQDVITLAAALLAAYVKQA